MPDSAEWLRFARQDLEAARALLELDRIVPRIVCFHAQQAAEKALKSALSNLGFSFPKTHSLIALEAMLTAEWRAKTSPIDLASLNAWAVEARYPSDLPDADQTDAETAVRTVEELFQALGF